MIIHQPESVITHAHITTEPVIETGIDMRPNTFANHAGTHPMTFVKYKLHGSYNQGL